MALEKAKEYLEKNNLGDRVIILDKDTSTVSLAAQALGIDDDMIAKTLSFYIDNKPILIVLSGNSRIDNKKYKEYFNTKAKMIEFENVEKEIGHSVGGVCPFGVNDGVDIYLDKSLKKYEYVYPACGSSNSAVKIKVSELESIIPYKDYIDIAK